MVRHYGGLMVSGEAGARPQWIVTYGSPQGRWVVLATVLGSGIVALDATVVNVALPAIGEDLGASVAGLQWTLNGYLLTLAAFILLGGSLGDRFGRRRVFVIGVVWFAVASLLCGVAGSMPMLVAARAFQGVGGALLTPGSLAILQASFPPGDRARAIGAWSGLGGVATAVGPFAGGWLVDALSWRYIFLLNLPLSVVVVAVALRHVPESSDPSMARGLDVAGAVLGAVGLAGVTYALIEAPERGAGSPLILGAAVAGVLGLIGFVLVERRSRHPMLPVDIFASRQFTGANLVTVAVYAALSGVFFLLVVHLQQVLGYSALAAGTAMFPVTIIMLALSARAGALAARIGPRLPMTAGPLVVAVGLLLMTRITAGSEYLTAVLPAAIVFGLGLALTVAPLTATVLAAVEERHAGVASGVNNAVARAGGLLAVAILPVLAGLTGDAYRNPQVFASGFRTAVVIASGLCAMGAAVAWLTIRNDVLRPDVASAPAPAPRPRREHHCCLDAPPLRPSRY
jgi:EmrB/QacA subfamily drug resistance transporter